MMPSWQPLTDDERFPALPPERRDLLRRLREHPAAPRWNLACGDRLTPAHLSELRAWARDLQFAPATESRPPTWLAAFTEHALATVPFYRARGPAGMNFADIPSFRRADLVDAPWSFVPDDQPLDDLLVFHTSGTTGPSFPVYSHPITANAYLPFLQTALARVGVDFRGDPDRVALACVHWQKGTYAYPSLMSYLDGAGFVKINLEPGQWRRPADAVAFLNACEPKIYSGDPYSLARLSELDLGHRPDALISSATTLLPGLRRTLEHRFGCPVLDVYSLTEAQLIGASFGEAHEVLSHDLYVEVLDADTDRSLPAGERGEVTVTGGRNPFLPLLRYRTGDFARLEYLEGRPRLVELEARAPVCLLDEAGRVVNTIDVSRALAPFSLPRFHLHQAADGELRLQADSPIPEHEICAALQPLFGRGRRLRIGYTDETVDPGRKLLQYSSSIMPPAAYAALFGATH